MTRRWKVCPARERKRCGESTYQSIQIVIAGHKRFAEAPDIETLFDKPPNDPPSDCLGGWVPLLLVGTAKRHPAGQRCGGINLVDGPPVAAKRFEALHEADTSQRNRTQLVCGHTQGTNGLPAAGGKVLLAKPSVSRPVLEPVGLIVGERRTIGRSEALLNERHEFIGWSADARAAHLGQVLNNIRFLILPRVRVAGLASSALAQAARRLPEDWKAETGVSALMAYTYVGAQHRGSCYAAAGWQRCERLTAGRPPGRSSGSSEPRAVWMKPLSDSWQDELCVEPRRRIGEGKSWHVQETADWAEVEYARGSHPDGRVRNRILRMGRAWLNRPGEPLPTIFPAKADQKAAYRLMSSGRVKMDHILASHQEALAERCRFEPLVLALQDSTTLNYHGLKSSRGLALIGSNRTSLTMGLPVHLGLACTPAGRPLGVFELNADFRDPPKSTPSQPAQLESARWTQGLERAQELSRACPETRVVTVCDREGDQWDMLNQAIDAKAGLLVRASRSTRRRVLTETGESQDLWSWMAMQPPRARKCIELQACGGTRARKRRKIDLELRVTSVRLQAAKRARRQEPIEMLAVSATEVQPVEGETALHWLLLSTEGEADAETAARLVKWYEQRWSIEEYFKVLKSGARVEERQLDAAEDLRKCLAFDAITACHVFDLTRMAREEPARKATELVDQDEIEML